MTERIVGWEEMERYNPTMLADWRFQRIDRIRKAGGGVEALNRFDDAYTRTALRFVLREQLWERDEARLKYGTIGEGKRKRDTQMIPFMLMHILEHDPRLYLAFSLGTGAGFGVHTVVQAHLLAGRTDSEIAAKVQIIPEAIKWYEKLFFNVRLKLEGRGWVHTTVLRHKGGDEDPSARWGRFLKWIGYYGGPHALDAALASYVILGSVAVGSMWAGGPQAPRSLQRKVVQLYWLWCEDPFTGAAAALARAAKAVEGAQAAASPDDNSSSLEAVFDAWLKSLKECGLDPSDNSDERDGSEYTECKVRFGSR